MQLKGKWALHVTIVDKRRHPFVRKFYQSGIFKLKKRERIIKDRKKKTFAPDMGLEPMTLRLKV